MFTKGEKLVLLDALRTAVTSYLRSQGKTRLPDMVPVIERHLAALRAVILKVENVKETDK